MLLIRYTRLITHPIALSHHLFQSVVVHVVQLAELQAFIVYTDDVSLTLDREELVSCKLVVFAGPAVDTVITD